MTRDFKKTVKARADRDAAFREALLTEGVEELLPGDVATGKAVLRDAIDTTAGVAALDAALARGLADAEAGRVRDIDEVFAELRARYGQKGESRGE
jgi:predicted transcriptional regulator